MIFHYGRLHAELGRSWNFLTMGAYLLNAVANDGSRLFISLPHTRLLVDLHDHLARMPGVMVTGLVRDEVMGAFIEFDFCRYVFVIVEESREYRFYVNPRQCPDEILVEVTEYCSRFLLPRFFPSVEIRVQPQLAASRDAC